jgi:hypothetical protein
VGYRSPNRRPKSTTPSPTTAPYELRPDAAKLINLIRISLLIARIMVRLCHRLKVWWKADYAAIGEDCGLSKDGPGYIFIGELRYEAAQLSTGDAESAAF